MTDPATAPESARPYNGLAIIAFVLSFVVTVAGVVLGIVALVQTRKTGARGGGFAIAAIILGAGFSVAWVIVALGLVASLLFVGQRSLESDDATRSGLLDLKIAELSYATSHDGVFTKNVSALADNGFTPSESTARLSIVLDSGGSDFCAQAISTANHFFHVTESVDVETGPCLG